MEGNNNPSDSDNEYSHAEKVLINKFRKGQDDTDSEQEIYAFSESDQDSDKITDLGIADSDVEGQENSDNDLPDPKAWGKNKRLYYETDYVDKDYGGFGDDEQAALMEEEEAMNIQKRLIEQLGEEDFSLDIYNKTDAAINENQDSIIKSDLTQMSKRQKLQLFQKDNPEFAGLVEDFKSKLTVAKESLHPIIKFIEDGTLPKCPASKFVRTNYELILNYCTNISFYLLLKSQRINIQNHPVVKRLYQYRQMLNKVVPTYLKVIKPQLDKILNVVDQNLKLKIKKLDIQTQSKKRKSEEVSKEISPKKLKIFKELEKDDEDTGLSNDESDVPREENELLQSHKKKEQGLGSEESGFSDNDLPHHEDKHIGHAESQTIVTEELGEKREITYQIAKNKGLTPYRKKEQRNPRVKHKLKYRKAKIRRKGAIREPRKEITRYSGEASGIKANLKKSVKIK